jgi:glycosyltransferase involved in cell wall biosynthesis
MKLEVVFLSGSLQLSGSTTWINTLIKGFEQQNIYCAHLVTGVPTSIKSSARQVFYTGRPRQQLWLRLMRWLQLHKTFKSFYKAQEASFYTKRAQQLLNSQLAEKVLVIKDFSSYLPAYFFDNRFIIAAVLHQQFTGFQEGYFYHKLCAVSKTVKENSNKLGFNVQHAIYNPLDIKRLRYLAEEYQPCEEDYLLFVGKLHKEKGIVELLESYHELLDKENINLKLIYVGEGNSCKLLQDYIAEHGLERQVKLIGFLNNPYPYIKNAKLLVLPSYSEAMPYVAIESAVLETNYLVSDFPSAKEFFPDKNVFFMGDNASVFRENLKDKIISSLESQNFDLKPGIIEKMSLAEVTKSYHNLLQDFNK